MAKITVKGVDDDIIKISGDFEHKFYIKNSSLPTYLAFSDGTVLSAEYTASNIWRFVRIRQGFGVFTKVEATAEIETPGNDNSTDILTLDNVKWVVTGLSYQGFAKISSIKSEK